MRNNAVGVDGERYSIVGHPLGWPEKTNNLMFLNKESVSKRGEDAKQNSFGLIRGFMDS